MAPTMTPETAKNQLSGTFITVGPASQFTPPIPTEDGQGPWVARCDDHGTTSRWPSRTAAFRARGKVGDWCADCQNAIEARAASPAPAATDAPTRPRKAVPAAEPEAAPVADAPASDAAPVAQAAAPAKPKRSRKAAAAPVADAAPDAAPEAPAVEETREPVVDAA
jgi:hypothetical protein